MASVLKVDKLDPQSGTALEIGTSGDTVTVPSGVGLTLTDSTLLLPTTITSTTEVKTNKISPATGVAFALGDSGDTFTVPSGATIVNSGTATGFGITAASFVPNDKPLVINGGMEVWQRGTSTVTMSDGYYNVDRYRGEETTDGTATWTQSTSVPDGFNYSLQVDCTVIDSSIGASQKCQIQYTAEAQDCQLIKFGTSDAETLTLAFWVKSNQTGQHSVALQKRDNTQYCQPKTYTVSVADTWEKKVLVFSALTTAGANIDVNNGSGLAIFWSLDAGTNLQGTADVWDESSESALAVSGDVSFMSSTSNNFYLTGVQLEVGTYTSSTIPPFRHETYGDNLSRCRRYCNLHMNTDQDGGPFLGLCFAYTSSNWQSSLQLSPPMRAVPTVTSVSGTNYYRIFSNGGTVEYDSISLNSATLSGGFCTVVDLAMTGASGGTAGYAGKTKGNSTGAGTMLLMDAEL